jgi:uncharacterized protein YciI
MMVVELAFTPDPRRLEARPAHRAVLQQLHADGVLVMAGPWRDDSGAVLVLDVDEDGLDAVLTADPYYSTPGVEVVRRRAWSPLSFG